MMPIQGIIIVISLMMSHCYGGRVMIMPLSVGWNSRLMNMLHMANILAQEGHQVSLLFDNTLASNPLYNTTTIDPRVEVVTWGKAVQGVETTLQDTNLLNIWANLGWDGYALLDAGKHIIYSYMENHFQSDDIFNYLDKNTFDLFIADDWAYSLVGQFLARRYNTPIALYVNWGPFAFKREIVPPYNLAFMPHFLSPYSDTMTFYDRINNVIGALKMYHIVDRYIHDAQLMALKYKRIDSVISEAEYYTRWSSLVFTNGNNVLNYPRPFMPNHIYIEGFHMEDTKPKPLPADIQQIIHQSGDKGLIIVSFGSLLRSLSKERNEMLAATFAKMSETVLWSFDFGAPPSNLGSNTKLFKWLPQKDLLAHPKTKLFVTHCGGSATIEAVHSGVPIVGIPVYWDQSANCHKMVDRRDMGKIVNYLGLTEASLTAAMRQVLDNHKHYKTQAKATSALVKDVPMPPRETFVYWVGYAIRHKGARHLISKPLYNLNVMQYFLLDVISAIATTCIVLLVVLCLLMRFIWKICMNTKKEKTN